MGNTQFQKRLFTVFMCFFMVLGMTIYNMLLHQGLSAHFFRHLLSEIWLVYLIAFVLDMFIVGPLAKKLVFTVLRPRSKALGIVSISASMVLCMVSLMSIFGSVMTQGLSPKALHVYPSVWIKNFIVALPYNLIIVGPLVRTLFVLLFPDLREEKPAPPVMAG